METKAIDNFVKNKPSSWNKFYKSGFILILLAILFLIVFLPILSVDKMQSTLGKVSLGLLCVALAMLIIGFILMTVGHFKRVKEFNDIRDEEPSTQNGIPIS